MRKFLMLTLDSGRTVLILMLAVFLIFPVSVSTGTIYAGEELKQDENQITGTVTDVKSGSFMPGVTVLIKGTTKGTITDMNGQYTINASPGDVIVFRFVGYETQEVTVGDQTKIDVGLEESVVNLDELVVIGYGVQKKKLKTGSSLNITGEEIQDRRATSAMEALQGISPGVSITRTNGIPGSGTKVYIRGIGTTGEAQPLYIVDGVAVSDIDFINPSDIESIDVLKDNATAAIYGSRAANGVVLVTTKKGTPGSMQVNYDGYVGWQNPYNMPEMLNALQYAEIMSEARTNSGLSDYNYADLVPNWDQIQSGESEGTDWLEAIRRKNARVQNHSISLIGGNEKSTYSAGASYMEQQGIYGRQTNSTYKRISLRLNSEHALWKSNQGTKIIVFGENLTYSNVKKPTIRNENMYWNDIHNMLVTSPFLPVYAESTDDEAYPYHYAISWNQNESNPVAVMDLESRNYTKNDNTIVGNAYMDIQPLKNLVLHSSFGIDNWYGSSRNWKPAYDFSIVNFAERDYVYQQMYSGYNWTLTNTLNYQFNVAESHNFNVLLGSELLKTARDLKLQGENENSIFQTADRGYLDNIDEVDPSYTILKGKDKYGHGIMSYFGRLLYDYKEKYLFTFVLRRDASSNFAEGHRWGTFRSVAAGWVISSEEFMDPFSGWLSYLKVRASWGQTGNEDIKPFQYLSRISYENSFYFFGPDKTVQWTGAYPPSLPNPDITWETSEDRNFGLDAYFINNQLQFTFDLYRKDTRDWLVDAPSLASNGTTEETTINGGDVTNNGFEMMLSWNDREGAFKYGISGTFAYNHNEVVSIQNEEHIIHGPTNVLSQGTGEMFRAEVGYPIGYFWGYETDGILQNEADVAAYVGPEGEPYFADSRPGDLKFVDQNLDGEINDDDKVMIGDPHPDYIFGLQFNAEFKGFFLQVTGNGQAGHQIAKSYRSFGDSPRNNYTTEILDRWHGEGTSNTIPRIDYLSTIRGSYISDLYIEDANFFRISNLTVGYNLNNLYKNMPTKETRIYVAARNLVTFTKYSGMDPEVGYGPTDNEEKDPEKHFPWASGIDLGLYPVARTFMVGLSIKF